MGFVSANEHQIGLECAGYVTRVGLGVQTEFQRGDRVILTRRDGGVFANRVKARHIFVQKIPDWLGFEVSCLHYLGTRTTHAGLFGSLTPF